MVIVGDRERTERKCFSPLAMFACFCFRFELRAVVKGISPLRACMSRWTRFFRTNLIHEGIIISSNLEISWCQHLMTSHNLCFFLVFYVCLFVVVVRVFSFLAPRPTTWMMPHRYTEGGFRVSPWLELLDMGKWVVPSSAVPPPGAVGSASE